MDPASACGVAHRQRRRCCVVCRRLATRLLGPRGQETGRRAGVDYTVGGVSRGPTGGIDSHVSTSIRVFVCGWVSVSVGRWVDGCDGEWVSG